MHWRRKWQPNPVFLPGEFQAREAGWAAIYGVAQSQTRLKRLSSSCSSIRSIPFLSFIVPIFARNITVIQVYTPTSNAEEAEVERFYEDLQDLLELTPKKDVLFIIGDWNAKVGSQETPGVTGKFGLGIWNEAGQRLIEFCQENALVIANTLFQQHKRRLYTWTSPDGQHRNQIDYILCSQRWRSSIQSAKTRPGADCGSDHELLITKFRLKLKKVGKTTRPFRYDLNQIPYDYTVEVRNRFKGLDLIECLMNYGMRFVTLYRRQGSRPSPWKRNAKKQNGCLGRPYK